MSAKLVTTDIIRALNDRNLQVFEDFDLVKNVIRTVPNEEAEDLHEVFREAIPRIERSLGRLKALAGELEHHCWTLLNYEGTPMP